MNRLSQSFALLVQLICVCAVLSLPSSAAAAPPDATTEKLLRRLEALEAEVRELRAEVKKQKSQSPSARPSAAEVAVNPEPVVAPEQVAKAESQAQPTPPAAPLKNLNSSLDPGQFGLTYRSQDAIRFGAYGEVRYGVQETDDGWSNGFDATRVVLLGTYPIKDNIIFNTEIEFEHGGIAKDADDKLNGAIEVEQLFVDFKFNDYLNWRSPGVDVVPVGYINLFHEPTQFYSVERPELYNGLIPSTWFEGSTSFYGKITDGLLYQAQVNTGLEDTGTSGDSDGKVPEGGYEAGISGTEALGLARTTVGDRQQLNNNLGYAGRLAYTPSIVKGLAGSSSIFYTPNTSPRGAYGTNADGSTRRLGKSDLTMVDTELRYRIPKTGVELSAEYVHVLFGNPANLRANNDGDPENNVGDSMYGYSVQAAYHLDASSFLDEGWELVPFYRYTKQDLQQSGVRGTDVNLPTGAGDQQYHTVGFAAFPSPKLVLKLDYQKAIDDAADSPHSDHILGGLGFFF